ncbi:MAG: thiol-disulfide oxidoreductase DCC family protein [Flavobacteriales bacterium]|nr:thiol-disulfide oxidoreductase DCC family protein [Flavobacteriales bacterium]MCB9204704.1 thiol-disulfide oxidoreductase DCC family protein [Flavobacteriales bacterium]
MTTEEGPILLFDGVCNLCSASVQFVLKRNSKENVRFASLQSEFAVKALKDSKLPTDYLNSLVLLENGKTYVKSDAALKLAKHLNGAWKLGGVFSIVPRFIRDAVYDWVAKNRYKWYGKKDVCWIPEPRWKNRFIET